MRSKPSLHQRFYLSSESAEDGQVRFSREESRHMLASLRLAGGDLISATDGAGKTYLIVIEDTSRGIVAGRVRSAGSEAAPTPAIWLFQGIIKLARMDALVEQCAELGIAGLVPVRCDRSAETVSAARLARWRRIAVEAMKQSLGSHLAEIQSPQTFERALGWQQGRRDLVLVASETETSRITSVALPAPAPARVAVWVGPEGGLTDRELKHLAGVGARLFSLGPRRLRSETAAAAAVVLVTERFAGS